MVVIRMLKIIATIFKSWKMKKSNKKTIANQTLIEMLEAKQITTILYNRILYAINEIKDYDKDHIDSLKMKRVISLCPLSKFKKIRNVGAGTYQKYIEIYNTIRKNN